MLLTKSKIGVLFAAGIIMLPAAGLTYRAMAVQTPIQKQAVDADAGVIVLDQARAEQEIRRLKAQVDRLRADNEDLKKRLQQIVGKQKPGDAKTLIKVYPAFHLAIPPDGEDNPGQMLIRIITNTVEPTTWDRMGGEGSMEYLQTAGCLIVRQSPQIQKEIQDLLDAINKAIAEGRKAAQEKAAALAP
jgi:hypothetical protein